jgi:hypothetical protein
MLAILAAIRPDSWNFPLLLHVLGATILVGGLVTAVTALVLGWRRTTTAEACAFARMGFRSLLFVAFPGWLLMRLAGEWVASREGWGDVDEEPVWLGIGYMTGEAGGLLLLISILLSGIGLRRLGRSGATSSALVRVSTVLAAIVLVAYIVAVWAMSAKPD